MKKLIPAICMLLVAASLLGTSTYAWFSLNGRVSATGLSVTAATSASLLISADGTTFLPNGMVLENEVTPFNGKVSPTAYVYFNGDIQFYKLTTGGSTYVDENGELQLPSEASGAVYSREGMNIKNAFDREYPIVTNTQDMNYYYLQYDESLGIYEEIDYPESNFYTRATSIPAFDQNAVYYWKDAYTLVTNPTLAEFNAGNYYTRKGPEAADTTVVVSNFDNTAATSYVTLVATLVAENLRDSAAFTAGNYYVRTGEEGSYIYTQANTGSATFVTSTEYYTVAATSVTSKVQKDYDEGKYFVYDDSAKTYTQKKSNFDPTTQYYKVADTYIVGTKDYVAVDAANLSFAAFNAGTLYTKVATDYVATVNGFDKNTTYYKPVYSVVSVTAGSDVSAYYTRSETVDAKTGIYVYSKATGTAVSGTTYYSQDLTQTVPDIEKTQENYDKGYFYVDNGTAKVPVTENAGYTSAVTYYAVGFKFVDACSNHYEMAKVSKLDFTDAVYDKFYVRIYNYQKTGNNVTYPDAYVSVANFNGVTAENFAAKTAGITFYTKNAANDFDRVESPAFEHLEDYYVFQNDDAIVREVAKFDSSLYFYVPVGNEEFDASKSENYIGIYYYYVESAADQWQKLTSDDVADITLENVIYNTKEIKKADVAPTTVEQIAASDTMKGKTGAKQESGKVVIYKKVVVYEATQNDYFADTVYVRTEGKSADTNTLAITPAVTVKTAEDIYKSMHVLVVKLDNRYRTGEEDDDVYEIDMLNGLAMVHIDSNGDPTADTIFELDDFKYNGDVLSYRVFYFMAGTDSDCKNANITDDSTLSIKLNFELVK